MEILIGATVSVLMQLLKSKVTGEYWRLALLVLLCLAAAAGYVTLVAVGYWETVAGILMTAGAFYAFVIQRFEN
jgi:hypothetical protein